MYKTCEYCNKEFFVERENNKRKYCSRSCHVSNNNTKRVWKQESKDKVGEKNRDKLSGNKNPNWKGGKLELICKECSNTFNLFEFQLKKQRGYFCSRACRIQYQKKNSMSDSQRRLHHNIKRGVSRYINEKKNYRKWINLVGYSMQDLTNHLESLFQEGMSWDNYGEWHVDHIRPVSSFNFSSFQDDEFKECWSLDNLQPLWAKDNMRKGGVNKYVLPGN